MLTNFGGVKSRIESIGGVFDEERTHGNWSANDQIAGTGDAVQIRVGESLDLGDTCGIEGGRETRDGEGWVRSRGSCCGEAGPSKSDGVGVRGSDGGSGGRGEGGHMNGDSLAKMHSRGIRLTGKKRPISPEIALDGEALGVHEKRIVVQEVDGQTVADFQGADERSLSGGNEVGDNQGELGLAAAGDNRALDRVL